MILAISLVYVSCGSKRIFLQQENFVRYYNENEIVSRQILEEERKFSMDQFSLSFYEELESSPQVSRETFDFVTRLSILDSIILYPKDTSFIPYLDSMCFGEKMKNDLDIFYCGSCSFVEQVNSHIFMLVNDERKEDLNEFDRFKNRYLILVNVFDRHLASVLVIAHYYKDEFSVENLSSRNHGNKFILFKEDKALDIVYQKRKNSKITNVTLKSKVKLKLMPNGQIAFIEYL